MTADGDSEVKFNTTVDLELSFKINGDVKQNDTIEFALNGFRADFENASDIEFAGASIAAPVPDFIHVPKYIPYPNSSGCFQTALSSGYL